MPTLDGSGKLLRRKSNNFFHKFHVSTTDFDDHTVAWDFNSQGFSIMVESVNDTDVVQYSFDGSTVHGDLTPGFSSQSLVFDERRANRIWFRLETEGDPVLVRVEAWRNEY